MSMTCPFCQGSGRTKDTFEDRVASVMVAHEASFENVIRTRKNAVRVMYSKNNSYWCLEAEAPFRMDMTPEELEDALVEAVRGAAAVKFVSLKPVAHLGC